MEDVKLLFQKCWELMQVEITVYDFTFSWWDVFIWSMLAAVIGWLVVRFMYE